MERPYNAARLARLLSIPVGRAEESIRKAELIREITSQARRRGLSLPGLASLACLDEERVRDVLEGRTVRVEMEFLSRLANAFESKDD